MHMWRLLTTSLDRCIQVREHLARRIMSIACRATLEGRIYEEILVDLEPGRVEGVLGDRTAKNPKAAECTLRCRDRGRDRNGIFSRVASHGASGTARIADQLHLPRNMTGAVSDVL